MDNKKHPFAEIRERIGVGQAEVGRAASVTQQLVDQWEHGKKIPSWVHIKNIKKAFPISYEELENCW